MIILLLTIKVKKNIWLNTNLCYLKIYLTQDKPLLPQDIFDSKQTFVTSRYETERVDRSKIDKNEFLHAATLEPVEADLIEFRGQPARTDLCGLWVDLFSKRFWRGNLKNVSELINDETILSVYKRTMTDQGHQH
jgi:hypothetical protein